MNEEAAKNRLRNQSHINFKQGNYTPVCEINNKKNAFIEYLAPKYKENNAPSKRSASPLEHGERSLFERAGSIGRQDSSTKRSLNSDKKQAVTPKITECPHIKTPFNPPMAKKERRDIVSLLEKEYNERLSSHREIYKDRTAVQKKSSGKLGSRTSRAGKERNLISVLSEYQKRLEKIAELKKVPLD
eukprot:TRINITY_DN6974_c0_g1_i10.p1 TRINITY_DN6974_c0_g1~~TRINITY_DN6974_c0_g1_i10.p1  ORF type:complete len:187 (-),score=44.33 TRINITY_DN6974_c0_g1_i10:242-802(-)